VEQGLAALEEAYELISRSGEQVYSAEYHRIKGELILRLSPENRVEAENNFRQAIEIARIQQAKILELRATNSLSRLLASQGKKDEAIELLNPIYNWFTEGFETRDFQSASSFLETLS
jgi:predicted ATPase